MIIPEMLNEVKSCYLHRHCLGDGRIHLNKVFLKLFEFSGAAEVLVFFYSIEASETINVFNRPTFSKFLQT